MASRRPPPWHEPTDDADERGRWRHASLRERGDALVDLLGLVDAIGRYPEPRTRWPGFRRGAPGRAEGSD